tara:strand:- start:117 stop:1265 length:1149 start_codon:yes stop_codon:yes gene_type:complete
MSQVSDYDIANASGAQVRADINLVLDAVKTLNSGSSDPTGAVAFMLYGDTSDNILKIRNSANSSFTEIGNINQPNLGLMPADGTTAMTGAFKLSDGAVNAPSLTFNTDTDTGFFKNASNVIGVATGGVQRFTVGSYGIELRNGAVFEFRKGNNANFTAFTASESISENRTYTLPPAVVDGGFLKTNASGVLTFETIAGVPVGSIFCRAFSVVPAGYLECNGAAVSRTTYSALFALIGEYYGAGNGSTTFNLPDLRGEFVRGFDNGRGVDSGRSLGTLQTADNNSHSHGYTNTGITVSGANHAHNIRKINLGQNNQNTVGRVGVTLGSGQSYQIGYDAADNLVSSVVKNSGNLSMSGNVGITISPAGSEARPRNIALMYIIKT